MRDSLRYITILLLSIVFGYIFAVLVITFLTNCTFTPWRRAVPLPDDRRASRLVAGGVSGAYVETDGSKLYLHSSYWHKDDSWLPAKENDLTPNNLVGDCNKGKPNPRDPHAMLPLFGTVKDRLNCDVGFEVPEYYQYAILENGQVYYWACSEGGLGTFVAFAMYLVIGTGIGLLLSFATIGRVLFTQDAARGKK